MFATVATRTYRSSPPSGEVLKEAGNKGYSESIPQIKQLTDELARIERASESAGHPNHLGNSADLLDCRERRVFPSYTTTPVTDEALDDAFEEGVDEGRADIDLLAEKVALAKRNLERTRIRTHPSRHAYTGDEVWAVCIKGFGDYSAEIPRLSVRLNNEAVDHNPSYARYHLFYSFPIARDMNTDSDMDDAYETGKRAALSEVAYIKMRLADHA